jgi:hypothetical protein
MHHDHRTLFDLPYAPAAAGLSAEDYLRLLHPPSSRGKATLMQLDGKEATFSRTHDVRNLPNIVGAWLDVSGYVALNRYFGPRARNPLAALNALYVDLDFHTIPSWQGVAPEAVAKAFLSCVQTKGIPLPSLLNDTGRGLAAIWLIEELPPHALPRWRNTISVLQGLFKEFGSDRRCTDAARVFRLPGTINRKCGREVRVIEGTLQRLPYDDLADCIYVAAGRPTREQLKSKRRAATTKKPSNSNKARTLRGLPAALRFGQIRYDLERLSEHWGGLVPEGLRNTWLHLYATCLTQEHNVADLEGIVRTVASLATPGLRDCEVDAIIKSALKRRDAAYASNPNVDGRLNYSGGTVAELLCVSDPLARQLQLRQVYSLEERTRRNKERLTARRRQNGVKPRDEYLAANTISAQKPWVAHGLSRSTWYRRGCPPLPNTRNDDDTATFDEISLISLPGACHSERPERPPQAGSPTKKTIPTPTGENPKKTETGRNPGKLVPRRPLPPAKTIDGKIWLHGTQPFASVRIFRRTEADGQFP